MLRVCDVTTDTTEIIRRNLFIEKKVTVRPNSVPITFCQSRRLTMNK